MAIALNPPSLRPEQKQKKLLTVDEVLRAAQAAKDAGASRLYGRSLALTERPRHRPSLYPGCSRRSTGLETCATLGMLEPHQAAELATSRPGLLQPQPLHLAAGLLPRDR